MAASDVLIQKGLGGLGGGISNYYDQKNQRKALNAQMQGAQRLQGEIEANAQGRTKEARDAYGNLLQGFEGNASDYFNALSGTDLMDYVQDMPEDFTFDKLAEIDAYKGRNRDALDAEIARAIGDVEAQGAYSGSLFSGATGKGIARNTADITARALKEAEGYAQNEEANKYQKYIDRFNQSRDIAAQRMSAAQSNIANKGNLFSSQSNIFGAQRGEITGIQSASDTARFASRAEEEAARAKKAGTTTGASSFFQGFGAGLMG